MNEPGPEVAPERPSAEPRPDAATVETPEPLEPMPTLREPDQAAEGGETERRSGRLIEVVRLVFIALLGTAGYTIAAGITSGATTSIVLGVFLGAATGYVAGGVFGRLTATTVWSVEQEFRRRPAAEIVVGVGGLICGLVVAFLATIPLVLIDVPQLVVWTFIVFVYAVMGTVGFRVARSKATEIYAMLGLKPKAVGTAVGEINVIDTSVLIDGRIVDLVRTGFLTGTLIIHGGVLGELQSIADASDPGRRQRGRRGLDNLAKLQRDPHVDVVLAEEAGVDDVDSALVRLARERGGALVTADTNLAKVAEAVGVPVRSIHALAAAFRIPLAPGDRVGIKLIKEGREHGQGVGYLEDGTMVVVEDAVTLIGSDVTVTVRNTLQTSTGRMVFASLGDRPA